VDGADDQVRQLWWKLIKDGAEDGHVQSMKLIERQQGAPPDASYTREATL
jgi:hypothetical protein